MSPPCLACLLALTLLQNAPPPPGDLGTAELAAATRAAVMAATDADQAAATAFQSLVADGQRLAELTKNLAAEAPPPPGPVADLPDESVEYFEAELERHRAHVEHLLARGPRLADLQALNASVQERLDQAPALEEAAENRIAAALPLLVELSRRLQAGVLQPADAELPEGLDVAAWRSRLEASASDAAERRVRLGELRAQIDVAAPVIAATVPADPEEIEAATFERDTCEILLSSKRQEREIRTNLEGQDPATVRSVVERGLVAYVDGRTGYETVRAEVEVLVEALDELDAAAAALQAKKLEDFEGGEGHPELQEARRREQLAEAMVEYWQERLDLFDRAKAALVELHRAVQDAGAAVALVAGRTIDVRAALEVAEPLIDAGEIEPIELPGDLDLDGLWAELKAICATVVRRGRALESLAKRIDDTEPREAASEEMKQQQQSLAEARRTLEEEMAFGLIVEEMKSLDDSGLLATLKPGGSLETEITAARAAVDEQRAAVQARSATIRDVLKRLAAIESPFAQIEISAAPGRIETIRSQLEEIAAAAEEGGVRLPPNASVDADRAARIRTDVRAGTTIEASDDELSPSEEELAQLSREQRAARDRLRYFEDLHEQSEHYEQSVKTYQDEVDVLLGALREVEQLERRRFAAAKELAARLGTRNAPARLLPYGIHRWLSGEVADAATAARRNERTLQDAILADCDRQQKRLDVYLAWMKWAQIGGEVSQRKVDLIAEPVGHVRAARTAVADLPAYKRQDLEYEAQELIEPTALWKRLLIAIADPALRNRFDLPLDANALELANLGRVQEEYTLAADAFRVLATVTLESRQSLDGAVEVLQASEAMRLRDYNIARHHAAIAARPSARLSIAAAYRDSYGTELPTPVDDRGWDRFYWANQLLAAEARLWGDRRWIATLEHRLSRLGIESEVSRYNRHVAEITAEVDSLAAAAGNVRNRINRLQRDYDAGLRANGLETLTKIAIIPIVAFLIARLLRLFTRRLGTRSGALGAEDESSRQRRFRTLTNVAGASITVLVWVIAAMYMLASLGMNITPIVASASVAGLALAFGAQALIRDFFAGFFILLEDQYTIGDVIDVGTASGTVEHISLRVTILRDLEGVVHYVPNGLVQRVSNRTKGWSRVVMEVQVSYGEDIDHVIDILNDVLRELRSSDPFRNRILDEPEVAGVQTMSESTVGIRLMIKTKPGKQWEIGREVRRRVKRRFDEEGIRAPYPQRVIHQLQPDPAPVAGAG